VFENAIFLFFTHPFDVGDAINFETNRYTVKSITLQYVKLTRVDGADVNVPCSEVRTARIHNITRSGNLWDDVTVVVDADTPPSVLEEIARNVHASIKANPKWFGGSYRVWWSDPVPGYKLTIVVYYDHSNNGALHVCGAPAALAPQMPPHALHACRRGSGYDQPGAHGDVLDCHAHPAAVQGQLHAAGGARPGRRQPAGACRSAGRCRQQRQPAAWHWRLAAGWLADRSCARGCRAECAAAHVGCCAHARVQCARFLHSRAHLACDSRAPARTLHAPHAYLTRTLRTVNALRAPDAHALQRHPGHAQCVALTKANRWLKILTWMPRAVTWRCH
jgi:Mechanosensitive ion channel